MMPIPSITPTKKLRLGLGVLALASALTAFGPGARHASAGFGTYSGPTCPGVGCNGGSVTCASFSAMGVIVTCYNH